MPTALSDMDSYISHYSVSVGVGVSSSSATTMPLAAPVAPVFPTPRTLNRAKSTGGMPIAHHLHTGADIGGGMAQSLSTSLPTFRTQQGPSGFPLFPAPGSAPMMRRPSLPPTPLTSTTAGSPEAPPSAPPTTTGGIFKFDPFVMQPSPGLFSRKRAFSVPAVPAYTDGSHPTPASSLAQIPERPSIEKDPINNMALHGQFMDFC